MSELKAYQKHIAGWILHLMHKHLNESRFDEAKAAMKAAVNEEELAAARAAWEEWKRGN